MKDDRSDLLNTEFSEYQDDDFDAIFESCKRKSAFLKKNKRVCARNKQRSKNRRKRLQCLL